MNETDRYSGSGMLVLPLPRGMARCLSCYWMRSGPDARAEGVKHRNETSHAVLASTHQPPPAGPGVAAAWG